MEKLDYKKFYNEVGRSNGWDFSKIKCITEGTSWDLYAEVKKLCTPSDILLDIGTGGGELAMTVADSVLLLVGIDQSTGMIETASKNLVQSELPNVKFFQMDANNLEFPQHFFNVVSCRHSDFCAKEIKKVRSNGGIFITQQVCESDKRNIKEAFGRGQAFGIEAGTLKERYIKELSEADFSDVEAFEFDHTEYYQTAEDLIFLLKHTPIIPNFGENDDDFQILQQLIKENQTEKGIRTNSARFVIIAK